MYRNIMIITSEYTGHGHKSITEALAEQIAKYRDVKLHIVDGYGLSGKMGLRIGKLYGTITRASRDLWKLIWDISLRHPHVIVEIIESSIHDSFMRILNAVEPDAIITTHPNYLSSTLNILEKHNINIPVYAMVADPVSITPLWCDKRAHVTLCPTEEARAACIQYGVPPEKIKVVGFPVRERFTRKATEAIRPDYDGQRPLNCLIMSGGEGSGNMGRIARIILNNFNSRVKIVCGRNKSIKRMLELTLLERYGDRIEILGFVKDIENLMVQSDILFARASPNTMMEAVMCNLPLVITGALPGQEEGNPAFAESHNLGVVCRDTGQIRETLEMLLYNNAEKLNKIKESQYRYRDPEVSAKIVDFILHNS